MSAAQRAAEGWCQEFYPIEDPALYDTESRYSFGILVGLHFVLASMYACHMYLRWTTDYVKTGAFVPKQTLDAAHMDVIAARPASADVGSILAAPSTARFSAFASRVRTKLFVFSVASVLSNVLIGTSWLFWLLGNLKLSDRKSSNENLNDSIKLQVVFYAIFPMGLLCFLISAFAFSDRFVALCISKNPLLPRLSLLSRRYLWIPVAFFVGIAASGYATFAYQVNVGNLQEQCFENKLIADKVAFLSSGALISFDFNCSSFVSGSTPYRACTSCNLQICRIQESGTRSLVAFFVFYLLSVGIGLWSALRMWLQASRQLSSLVRTLLQLSKWKTRAVRLSSASGSAPQTASAAEQRVMNKPFALVWLGLMFMVLGFLQSISIVLILVSSSGSGPSDGCFEQTATKTICGPCDTSCRSTAEVLANWILLDPHVLSFSSLAAEFAISAIMGAIQLWLVSKSGEARKVRAAAPNQNAKEAHEEELHAGQNLALVMSMQIGQEASK
jgi:hypothetical protein